MAKYFEDPCVMAIVSNVKIIKQPMLPNLIFEQSEKTHFSIALKTTGFSPVRTSFTVMKIFVKAKPRAKNEKIEKIGEDCFKVSVKEPPEEGKANQAIVKALAEYFKVNQSTIKLVSGFSSKNKIFETG